MIIGLALSDEHPWRAEALDIGTVSFDGAVAELVAAARLPLDLLLVSSGLLAAAPAGVEALRRFRVARADTRVVVSHPANSRPGDPVLAACVAMGIYDLAEEPAHLADILAAPGTYADAAKWGVAKPVPGTGGAPPAAARVGKWLRIAGVTAGMVMGLAVAGFIVLRAVPGHPPSVPAATAKPTHVAHSPVPMVTAFEPTVSIPIRSTIHTDQLKTVKVPAPMAAGLVQDAALFAGKTTFSALEPGDLIYENELCTTPPLDPGYAALTVKVAATDAGQLVSGDRVNVYAAANGARAQLLGGTTLVLACYDAQGSILPPSANQAPASVELAVSQDLVPGMMAASKANQIYLARQQ